MVQTARKRLTIKRVAFTLIGDGAGTGVHNYLLNLVGAISAYSSDRIKSVLFVGVDVSEQVIASFRDKGISEVVRATVFDIKQKNKRLAHALITGIDQSAADCFLRHAIDVVFESAQFYGARFPIPVIAWLPDFQHRHLPQLFSIGAYWKRELGFRAQVAPERGAARRWVMLSSEDARDDCERFYPSSKSRTSVVRFAVPTDPTLLEVEPTQVVREYGLPEHFFYLPNQFWKHKNHLVVIEALHALRQRGNNLVVAATGKAGDSRHPRHFEALRARVSTLGLVDNFRFLGLIPRSHVTALMRGCVALINPSLFEGWSTPVEEARSLGVPMLLSDLRVHREQMGDAAHYFEPHSVEQLSMLLEAQPRLSMESRLSLEETARGAAPYRVQKFCTEFGAALDKAIAVHNKKIPN